LVPNTGTLDGTYVYVWNGHTYVTYTLDSTVAGGVADVTDSFAVAAPVINPGTAFYLNNQTGAAATNTYVGTVHIGSGTYPGTSTNTFGSTLLSLIAPVIPVGGGVSSVCGLTNVASALDGDYIYLPNVVNGQIKGFTVTTIDSTLSTGFGDVTDSFAVPEPQISVGSGFFFANENGGTINWVQSIGQ
jgi:hypothetical protein